MAGLLYSSFIAAYEDNLKEVMRSKIRLLAASSASALVFGDRESAATLLSSLKEHTATRYVQMYDADRQLFAEYRRPGQLVDVDIDDYESDAFFQK